MSAVLEGRAAGYFAVRGQPIPPWAVLNRLAHADWSQLTRLVEGNKPGLTTERFVAGHLLARAATPDRLRQMQREVLVPLEMQLIDRGKVDCLTADEVLEAGAEALDTRLPDQ